MQQQPQSFDFGKIKSFARRRWRWFFVPFIVLLIATAIITTLWPRKYPARCIIFIGATIEQEQIDREAQRYSRHEEVAQDKLERLKAEMLADGNLRELILGGENSARIQGLADNIDTTDLLAVEKKIKRMREKEVTFRMLGNEFIEISYSGKTPQIAQAVLSELFSKFREQQLRESKAGYQEASRIRNQRLRDLKQQIDDAGNQLREFREKNADRLLVTDADDLINQLEETKARLKEIEGELQGKGDKRVFLNERLQDTPEERERSKSYRKSTRRTAFEQASSELEIQLLMLKDQYTEDHPRMKKLQEQINKLKDEMKNEPEELVQREMEKNEAYQKYREQKSDVDIDIMTLEAEQQAKTEIRKQFEDKLSAIPRLKEQEERYVRTMQTYRVSHEEAIKAKEEADKRYTLAEQDKINAFQLRGGVHASPLPDPKATFQVFFGFLFLTLVLSAASVGLREITDQSLKTVDEARDFLALPSLGIVPVIVTPKDRRRKRTVRIILAVAAVLLIAGAIALILTSESFREDVVKAWNWLSDLWDRLTQFIS